MLKNKLKTIGQWFFSSFYKQNIIVKTLDQQDQRQQSTDNDIIHQSIPSSPHNDSSSPKLNLTEKSSSLSKDQVIQQTITELKELLVRAQALQVIPNSAHDANQKQEIIRECEEMIEKYSKNADVKTLDQQDQRQQSTDHADSNTDIASAVSNDQLQLSQETDTPVKSSEFAKEFQYEIKSEITNEPKNNLSAIVDDNNDVEGNEHMVFKP